MSPLVGFLIGLIVFLAVIVVLTLVAMRRFNDKIARRRFSAVEITIIAGMFAGIIGMFQPFNIELYEWGFLLLLLCTLAYIVWSHVVPKSFGAEEAESTSVS